MTLAVELGKGVVVEVQFVKRGVLLARWKLPGKRNSSISRLVAYNKVPPGLVYKHGMGHIILLYSTMLSTVES